ncbi:unnamed protein product [Rotaria sordida]|uniref:Uncharacterized protein n=1 Tax=Rotaria sordida TaxID=392033 RepID=A0A819IZ42_9BILA|nr:unnamed protein product [Rotaria sordida]CAF3944698.1 unnamed protein product [Rotaria sordida]
MQGTIYNCSSNSPILIQWDQIITMILSEISISAKMLSYDVYELKLTVIIIASSNFTSSSSVRVTIALLQIVIDNKLIIQHRVFQIHQMDYQLINSTTQVVLYYFCLGNYSSDKTIKWNIDEDSHKLSTKILLFGLHLIKLQIKIILLLQMRTSSVSFKINQCLSNGSCSINPYNGTTITLLSISRLNWFDKDGIKDYSFWANDFSKQSIIEFTSVFDFQVQLLYENVVVRNDLTEIKN